MLSLALWRYRLPIPASTARRRENERAAGPVGPQPSLDRLGRIAGGLGWRALHFRFESPRHPAVRCCSTAVSASRRRRSGGGGGGGGGDIASRRRARRVQTSSAAVAGPRSLVVHQRARKPSRLPTTSRRAADRRSRRDRIQGSRPARRHIASRRRAPVPSARRVVAGAARRAVCRRRRRCPGELSARILALLLQERNCCSKPFSNSKNFLIENFNQKF